MVKKWERKGRQTKGRLYIETRESGIGLIYDTSNCYFRPSIHKQIDQQGKLSIVYIVILIRLLLEINKRMSQRNFISSLSCTLDSSN